MKKALTTPLILLFLSFNGYSQKAPIKFGRIDKKDLEMKVCSFDSTAPAVILCDYGYFNGQTFKFTRLLRIKILKKEGYSWANRVFPTYSKSYVKGITYNLEDGEIIKEKLKHSSIYSEHVYNNYYRTRAAMPNVKVGSVIDIEYTFLGLPRNWYFQQQIPVLRSELVIENSVYLTYRKNFFGYIPLDIVNNNQWVALDVPAFKEEHFMNSKENYISKFEIEIRKVNHPNFYIDYAADWDAVNHTLLDESNHLGDALDDANYFIKDMAEEIKKNNYTEEQQVIAALNTLHKAIKWNGSEWLYPSGTQFVYEHDKWPNLESQYDKGVGNSTDINVGLILLLRRLGFEVYPVALSTRSNGLLSTEKPSLSKLNYLVAYAKVDGEFIFLDATDELLPYNLLPKRCLNQRGRIIDNDTSVWVDMNTKNKYKKVASYNLSLNNDMTLSGTINYASYDYAAYEWRKKFEGFADEDEYIDELIQDMDGLYIDNAKFTDVDSIYKPIREAYDVTIENVVIQSDSLIYLPMMTYERIEDNLFNSKTREFPVDFTYLRERSGVINISLPPNVEVIEIPEPLMLRMPDNSIDYVYSLTQMGNKLILNYRLRINKSIISILEYDKLRTFYEYVVEKETEPVILKVK